MKTREQVIEAVKNGRESACLDSRDYSRLVEFFPVDDWKDFGFELEAAQSPPNPREWTEEEVMKQFADDVEFGFEKALGKRGISAGLMNEVVKMWLWVFDDPLQDSEGYSQYGLPLLKAVALKYGFDNPIGDKAGDEFEFSSESEN